MKKVIIASLCLLVVLALTLSGCGSSESQVVEQPVESQPVVYEDYYDDTAEPAAPAPEPEPEIAPAPAPAPAPVPAPAPAPTPKTHEVKIVGFKFVPAQITVNMGDTIKWTNEDSAPHTATANSGAFDTDRLGKGESSSLTMTEKGTFAYICNIHPSMKATVTVE